MDKFCRDAQFGPSLTELGEKRQEAAEAIRSLIEAIILTPSDQGLQIDVRDDLAGILTVASGGQTKTPARFRTGVRDALASQVQMVAGAGFEPAAFRL